MGAAAVGDAAGCLLRAGIEALLSRCRQRERPQRVLLAALGSKREAQQCYWVLGSGTWK